MTWIDRLLGRPTLDNLVREVTQSLKATVPPQVDVDLDRQELTVQMGHGPVYINLANLFHEYQRRPRGERSGVIQEFLAGLVSQEDSVPKTYEQARRQLLPVVRSNHAMGIAQLSIRRKGLQSGQQPDWRLAVRPLVDELVLALVIDMPKSMAYVTDRRLADWGVTWDQALADATDNLRGLPEHGGWDQIEPGVWSGVWGDTYESSRLLLPDLVHRLNVSRPVAMVPFRNVLLVASASNPAALEAMVRLAHRVVDESPRWVSFELFELDDRTWRRVEPPAGVQPMVRELRLRNLAESYAAQKQLLDDQLAGEGLDVFVATYTLVQGADQRVSSYCVWSEGVDSLLPMTDQVAMLHPLEAQVGQAAQGEGTPTWHVRLPWDLVMQKFGSLLQKTDDEPPRYRTVGFPSREDVHALANTQPRL